MLAKLTKYEFKATGRIMLLFYAALIILTVLNKFTNSFGWLENSDSILSGLPVVMTWVLYGTCIAAISVMTIIIIVQRFYRNLLQSEGYLMHVLPVRTWQHIVSKLIPAIIWSIASIIMIILSALIVSGAWSEFFAEIGSGLSMFVEYYGAGSAVLTIIVLVLMGLAGGAGTILKFYAAMSIGQLSDNHKVLASFGSYIGIEIAESTIESVGLALITYFMSNFEINLSNMDTTSITCMVILLLYAIVNAAVYYIITEVLLRKHLNLQ